LEYIKRLFTLVGPTERVAK